MCVHCDRLLGGAGAAGDKNIIAGDHLLLVSGRLQATLVCMGWMGLLQLLLSHAHTRANLSHTDESLVNGWAPQV